MNKTTAEVLSLLRQAPQHITSATLCAQLGISRTAVWKHICQLRENGYSIDSAPHRGYRLAQAVNLPSAMEVKPLLGNGRFGRDLCYFAEVDSTNRVASELAGKGAAEGTVVVADTQTAGRGRLQRTWFSPPGVNLSFSVILRPAAMPYQVPQLSLVAGLALCRALERLHPQLSPQAKWPNDLFLNGRKLAGILCTMVSEMERVQHLIIGIGVNVNIGAFPAELAAIATSLRQALDADSSRPQLLASILAELETAYDEWQLTGLASFVDEWNRHSWLSGRRVTVETLNGNICGRALGISATGALRLQPDDGPVREIIGGDVHIQKTEENQ